MTPLEIPKRTTSLVKEPSGMEFVLIHILEFLDRELRKHVLMQLQAFVSGTPRERYFIPEYPLVCTAEFDAARTHQLHFEPEYDALSLGAYLGIDYMKYEIVEQIFRDVIAFFNDMLIKQLHVEIPTRPERDTQHFLLDLLRQKRASRSLIAKVVSAVVPFLKPTLTDDDSQVEVEHHRRTMLAYIDAFFGSLEVALQAESEAIKRSAGRRER